MYRLEKILLVIMLMMVSSVSGMACRCDDPGTIREAFERVPIVLHGKVLTINHVTLIETMSDEWSEKIKNELEERNDIKSELFETEFIIQAELEIIKLYKGDMVKEKITVYTPLAGASCGYNDFEIGGEYLLYAYPSTFFYSLFVPEDLKEVEFSSEGTCWTNHCTRTRPVDQEEIRGLNEICNE